MRYFVNIKNVKNSEVTHFFMSRQKPMKIDEVKLITENNQDGNTTPMTLTIPGRLEDQCGLETL